MGVADLRESTYEDIIDEAFECCETFQSEEIYDSVQIHGMSSWFDECKETSTNLYTLAEHCDPSLLNQQQKLAYNFVLDHFKSGVKEPLHMIITGPAGCGKSFLINCIRQVLENCCAVRAFFGITAFNINGVTLHSLLQLPIKNRNRDDLKRLAFSKLQERLEVHYIIIDEFSVVGQKMLTWIVRCCRQAKACENIPFGEISVILVGDIAQLPPVMDSHFTIKSIN